MRIVDVELEFDVFFDGVWFAEAFGDGHLDFSFFHCILFFDFAQLCKEFLVFVRSRPKLIKEFCLLYEACDECLIVPYDVQIGFLLGDGLVDERLDSFVLVNDGVQLFFERDFVVF